MYSFTRPRITRYEMILEENFGEPPPEPEDPNADIPLCRSCAEAHHEEWNNRWAEYYRGLL